MMLALVSLNYPLVGVLRLEFFMSFSEDMKFIPPLLSFVSIVELNQGSASDLRMITRGKIPTDFVKKLQVIFVLPTWAPKGGPHGDPRCPASRAAVRATLWRPSGRRSKKRLLTARNLSVLSQRIWSVLRNKCKKYFRIQKVMRMVLFKIGLGLVHGSRVVIS